MQSSAAAAHSPIRRFRHPDMRLYMSIKKFLLSFFQEASRSLVLSVLPQSRRSINPPSASNTVPVE